MPRTSLFLASALVAVGASAGTVAAQACLGLPTRDGQIAVAGAFGLSEGYNTAGGQFHVDVTGPASFGFAYSRDFGMSELDGGGDAHANLFEGRAAYELYLLEPSICAVAGVRYQDLTGLDQLGVPVGFAFGKTLQGETVSTTIYAQPQYLWLRTSYEDGALEADTSNEFLLDAGITLGFQRLYIGTGVVVTSVDNDDARLGIRAGFLF